MGDSIQQAADTVKTDIAKASAAVATAKADITGVIAFLRAHGIYIGVAFAAGFVLGVVI